MIIQSSYLISRQAYAKSRNWESYKNYFLEVAIGRDSAKVDAFTKSCSVMICCATLLKVEHLDKYCSRS